MQCFPREGVWRCYQRVICISGAQECWFTLRKERGQIRGSSHAHRTSQYPARGAEVSMYVIFSVTTGHTYSLSVIYVTRELHHPWICGSSKQSRAVGPRFVTRICTLFRSINDSVLVYTLHLLILGLIRCQRYLGSPGLTVDRAHHILYTGDFEVHQKVFFLEAPSPQFRSDRQLCKATVEWSKLVTLVLQRNETMDLRNCRTRPSAWSVDYV